MFSEENCATRNASDEWRSIIAIYSRPDIAQACLLLQDTLGVDVLVLLHLVVTQSKGGSPWRPEHVRDADAAIRDWRETVVKPLRAVRRALNKEDPAVQALRVDIQRCELEAERQGLALLSALTWPKGETSEYSVVQHVVRFYSERTESFARVSEPNVAAAIKLLEKLCVRTAK